jgi:hypothetical protein
VKELTGFENALDGEKAKIKTFSKSLTDCTKEAYAKAQQLKKDRAKPAAIKHVEKMVSAGSAFAKTMANLADEADDLIEKARLLLEDSAYEDEEGAPGAPKADKFLLQGLKAVKSQPGLFALAIGGKGAYLVAGPRLAPDALKQAKAETGGSFLRGECEWSQPKKAFVFVLPKKPPSGLAKKIRKAILDQTLKKLQVKVLVRGPGGEEIDAETDADTLGAVDLEDAPETAAAAPPPPSKDSILFANRKRALSPAYDKAIALNPASQAELDNLLAQAMAAAKANNWKAALELLDRYEVAIKQALFAAPKPAKAKAPGDKPAKPKRTSDGVYRQFQKLWEMLRKVIHTELVTAEQKIIAYCKGVNADPNAEITFDIGDLEAKAKKLFTVLDSLDERLIAKADEVLTAMTEADRSAKHEEAKAIVGEYQKFVNGNDTLAALQTSQIAPTDIRQRIITTLNTMKSKM